MSRGWLAGQTGKLLPQPHPELEPRPVGLGDIALAGGIDPRTGEEHRQHLLAPPVPQPDAPRARAAVAVEAAEERGARASTPPRELGRRGQARASAMGADAEVKVPGLAAGHLHRRVAVEDREHGRGPEAPFEDGALDAGAEDHVLPTHLEHLPEERQQRGLGALDVEVLRPRPVEVGVRRCHEGVVRRHPTARRRAAGAVCPPRSGPAG